MQADYDPIAAEWSSHRQSLPPKDAALFDEFLSSLPRGGRILDLGCGSGVPIARLAAGRGFSVSGVDHSEKLLELARANVPTGRFLQSDVETYTFPGHCNGVVLWDVIFHLPREKHAAVLGKIYDGLVDGGLLIMSSGGSVKDIPPFTDVMFGETFFYDAFTPGQLCALCKQTGFQIREHMVLDEPDGERNKGRIGLVLAKLYAP